MLVRAGGTEGSRSMWIIVASPSFAFEAIGAGLAFECWFECLDNKNLAEFCQESFTLIVSKAQGFPTHVICPSLNNSILFWRVACTK